MTKFFHKNSLNRKILFTIFLQLSFFSAIHGQIKFEPQPSFFRNQREIPLVSLATKQDILVSNYGAIKNDGIDDLKAIQAAISAAKAASSVSNPVRVVFEKGIYDVKPPTGESQCLFVTNANNIILDGNGAEIRNHNPMIGFIEVKSCTNVIIKGLIFDYAILPFTQGVVSAVDLENNSFTLKIDAGFPSLTESHFTTARRMWGCLKDATGMLKPGAENLFPYKGWSQISENTFKVNTPNSTYTSQVEVGDYFVQIARNNGKSIFNTIASKNVTFLGINIYSSPSASFSGQDNYEFNIINCNVIPKPESGRVQSGNGDHIHIIGSYFGPWVQGCRFESNTDDTVNLKHSRREIVAIVSPWVLQIKNKVTITDKIILFNPRKGVLLGTNLAITKIENLSNNVCEITFNGNHNVTEVGEHQTADKIYLTNCSSESFVFRDNTIKNGRRFGMLLQASYGQIKNCKFENLSSSAISIDNHVDWSEGFVSNNIEITNNTFKNCGLDTSFIENPAAATITVLLSKLKTPCKSDKWCGTELAQWQGLKNITITNNNFIYNKSALNLQNINGGIIKNNKYTHNPNDLSLKPGESPQEVHTFNCSNLNFEP